MAAAGERVVRVAGVWGQVWPNLLANGLWGAPAFVVHHVLMRRHSRRQHETTRDLMMDLLGGDEMEGAP